LTLQQFKSPQNSKKPENPQQTSTAATVTINERVKRNSGNQIYEKVSFEILFGNNNSIVDQLALNVNCNAKTLYQNKTKESCDSPRVHI
jgi:hypothetical protein